MSINLARYTVLSREQFTQEFLPTMAPDGKYFTWEQVNCNERPDHVSATQVWTIYRQDDGSMVAFNRPALGANEVGYVVCAEDLPGGNDLLAAHWWATEAQADAEIYRWAKKLAKGSSPKQLGWSSSVLFNADVLRKYVSDARPFALMSEEEFAEEYQPYMRSDGNYYEAADIRHVNRQHVWTVFDGDDKGGLIARAGLISDGCPVGYLTTVVPWDSLGQRAIWATPVDSLVRAAESKTPLNGFRSNISFERTVASTRRSAAVAGVRPYANPNGRMARREAMREASKSIPTRYGKADDIDRSGMSSLPLDVVADGSVPRRLDALEANGEGLDEHVHQLENRIADLENLVRVLTQNLDGTIANVGAIGENMKAVARLLEQA
jgi:hypothetical protein